MPTSPTQMPQLLFFNPQGSCDRREEALAMPKVQPTPMHLPQEILVRVGHDSPPQRVKRRERLPRELRETRKQMTYHWF